MKRDAKYEKPETGGGPRGVYRTDFLFAAGSIAVVAGLFFPLRAHVLDVFLVFGGSLTAAVLVIALSAQGASQVQSFPLLVVLVTTLRMALCVACAKLILLQGNAGTVVNWLGHLTVGGSLFATILVFGLLACGIFWIVCKIVRGIGQSGTKFICDIVPIKHVLIGRDLHAGVISESQACDRQTQIEREAGFLVAMRGTAKFMLCDSVIELVIIVVSIAVSLAMCAATPEPASIVAETYGILAVGAGVITQASVLITAMACGYLVRKSSVCPGPIDSVPGWRRFRPERIKVCASEVAPAGTKERRCGETVLATSEAEVVDSEFIEERAGQINDAVATAHIRGEEELSGSCEYEACDSDTGEDTLSLWANDEIADASGYEAIAELIEKKSCGETKAILMAGARVEELPVTIPVNVGMLLAKKDQRCLLIDFDSERDAIARVFDIDFDIRNGGTDSKDKKEHLGIPSCVENLWVWPAGNFYRDRGGTDEAGPKVLIEHLRSEYDRVLIYAPNAGSLIDWEQLANSVQIAMVFGDRGPGSNGDNSRIYDFQKLLVDCGCEVLRPVDINAEAVSFV
ncbi:MAG: FHIPEP family type III secretion protein [Planctomycetota bacterium]|jgi:hypothetical protein